MGLRKTLEKKLGRTRERRGSNTAQGEDTTSKEGNCTPEPSASSSGSSSPPSEIPAISFSDESLAEPTTTGKRKPSDARRSGIAPRPRLNSDVMGKRKPQDTAALVASRPRANSYQTPTSKREGEPSPADYLYFGPKEEGGASSSNAGGSAPTGDAANRTRPRQTPSASGGSHTAQTSRTDDSGFLKTGVAGARQQMGYQNLTYGGSLQYDYSGTQAPY
ncbi:hypothetical protein PG994_011393 [Apiospora phragmitis]|uniref:Uncharacterized protein n=1 Tax=Apiospora phragmitis TaxID=2905665 RepID=A0ABR1TSQ0_9PEZI